MDSREGDRRPAPGAAAAAQKAPDLSELPPTSGDPGGRAAGSLDTLLDVSLPVAIEFGRTNMTVQEVLELGSGSVIQLDRMVGEPVDMFISDHKLAEGELVVIG